MQDKQNELRDGRGKTQQITCKSRWLDLDVCMCACVRVCMHTTKTSEDHSNSQT